MEAILIFPHQLFRENPVLKRGSTVFLIEDDLFFHQYPFHKHKLILHRASMKAYQHYLESQGYSTRYLDAKDRQPLETLFRTLANQGFSTVRVADPTDYLLTRRINRYAAAAGLKVVTLESPNFICTTEYLTGYFSSKKRYFLTEFYIEQRKRFAILCENGKPVGDKWTFDSENRKRLPKSIGLPAPVIFERNTFVAEAMLYVTTYFASNPGNADNFNYAITHDQATRNLHDFILMRLENYGTYQDAISTDETFLFHSVLSPALNIGLLSPDQILQAVLAVKAPVNSVEGFVRQVLGWREFIRAVYLREGVYQRTNNHWNYSRPLPQSFWRATTGILPVDNVIQKSITHCYANHIERLMILGNFMLLCEIHPDEVYAWFMSMFIDAYDWVMVPNVYGMSQYADGGKMSTKPYISGSNYIRKMSHFEHGKWVEIWDALYWCFIARHKDEFARNPRMSMMVQQLKKIAPAKMEYLEKSKSDYFDRFLLPNTL